MPEVKIDEKRKKQDDDSNVARDQWERYVRARDNGHTDYLDTAQKCNNFYLGDQWDPEDKKKLEDEGRPALTINMVLTTVNAVLGEQTSKRSEFKYKAKAEGVESTPGVMTKLMSAIKDAQDYDWVESQVFADSIIQHGRGYFDIRVEFDDNMLGEIKIKSDDPTQIMLDPDAKEYDPSTWQEVYETKWMSLEEVEAAYGKKARTELQDIGINGTRIDIDSIQWAEDNFGDTENDVTVRTPVDDAENRTIRQVRVIERQHVRMVPCRKFVDLQTGDTKTVPATWDEQRAEDFSTTHNLAIITQVDKKVRWTVTSDSVVLHDDWSPYRTFTKIPYFSYFRRGKPFGLVTNLISPQEQLNKLSSQELHIVNTTANSGWIMERGSLSGMTADDLRNQGAETGLVLEINPGKKAPEKIQPNRVPTGIERAAIKSAQFIKEISGVNDAALGSDSAEVSGVALDNKVLRAQVQMQVPFDNLQRSRYLVANKLLELVQQFYTEERVFKVATEGMDFENMDGKEQTYVVNQQKGAGEIINDITIGKYEVALSTVPARDSYDDMQFAEALNLMQVGVPIPPDRIVEYSHLAHKDELAQEIRDMSGRGEVTPEQQRMMQLQQQAQEQMLMAEVANAQASVSKIEAETLNLISKASQTEGGMNAPEIQIQIEALDNKLAIARENVKLRMGLAEIQHAQKAEQAVISTQSKLVTDRENNQAKMEQEQVKQLGGLAQSRLSKQQPSTPKR
jgi:hypothetical protein